MIFLLSHIQSSVKKPLSRGKIHNQLSSVKIVPEAEEMIANLI